MFFFLNIIYINGLTKRNVQFEWNKNNYEHIAPLFLGSYTPGNVVKQQWWNFEVYGCQKLHSIVWISIIFLYIDFEWDKPPIISTRQLYIERIGPPIWAFMECLTFGYFQKTIWGLTFCAYSLSVNNIEREKFLFNNVLHNFFHVYNEACTVHIKVFVLHCSNNTTLGYKRVVWRFLKLKKLTSIFFKKFKISLLK